MTRRTARLILAAAVLGGTLACAHAQQATQTPAATMPAKNKFTFRQLFKYVRYRSDPTDLDREGEDWIGRSQIKYGLRNDLSIELDVPAMLRRVERRDETYRNGGLGDVKFLAAWRFFKNDFGPIDTTRAAAIVGLSAPTGHEPFGSAGVDPTVGVVLTHVQGRHGLNAAVRWTFTTRGRDRPLTPGTSEADLLRYDLAYLYRLAPAKYSAETHGSWYAMVELTGLYETNGDNELFVAPGIMYEAREYAVEASVQLPVFADLDHRPKRCPIVTVGFRLLF